MKSADLAELTATELLLAYQNKSVSPVEVLSAVIKRVEQLNPLLNAFSMVDVEGALRSAQESERRWMANKPMGLLDGIPVSIKDLILVRGWPTLRGSRTVDAHQSWDVDAPGVARLREAGAVFFAKTCSPEFGCKCETNSPLTGVSRNPWDLKKSPGGSSGGSAAAVAAGMGPISLGTDGAGSVRIPAAFCGGFGMKPSFGRVPTYPSSAFGTLSHIGPHTMCVEDAALAMNVLKRPDARDWASLPPDDADYGLDDGIRGLRIAFSPTLGYVRNVHPEVAGAVKQAVAAMEALGANVEQIDPLLEDPADVIAPLWLSASWSVWSGLTASQQAVTDPDFRAQALLGEAVSALQLHQAAQRRANLGSSMRQFMQNYDLLITPTVPIPAFDARDAGHSPVTVSSLIGWTPFTYPFNLTQQPAATLPCGQTSDGLPIGIQFIGPMFGDAVVLRAARAYQQVRPLLRPPIQNLKRWEIS